MAVWKRADGDGVARGEQQRKSSVLYVEDEQINWELTEMALREHYTLKRAATSREAFSALATNVFDLILMDIQLSGSDLNGIEITQILKDRFRGTPPDYTNGIRCPVTPIVFVTAYSARYQRDTLMSMGGADLVTKPINFTSMQLLLSRMLSRQTASRVSTRGA